MTPGMLTAFLTRADVSRHLQALRLLREWREALSKAGGAEPEADAELRPDAARIRHAQWPGVPAFSVSVVAGGKATLHLHDSKSGKLLCVMDAGHLMALRASLTGALATDLLAREDARHVAVLGSGSAASSALKALRLVRSLQRVWVYEEDPAANTELALRLQSTLATSVRGTDSAEEAAENADVVVLVGGAPLPTDVIRPGAHVVVLNADTFEQPPLPAALLARARRSGDTPAATRRWGHFGETTTLSALLANPALGRQSPDDVTLFVSTGPAWLDLLTAWHVYEGARTDEAPVRLDLES